MSLFPLMDLWASLSFSVRTFMVKEKDEIFSLFFQCLGFLTVKKTEKKYLEFKGVYGSRSGTLAGVSDFGGKESEEANIVFFICTLVF